MSSQILLLWIFFISMRYDLFTYGMGEQLRANITLRMLLNFETNPDCDETVYKIVICIGEFTNKCKIIGPVSRFMQPTCAAQGPMESITFPVHSLKTPIEMTLKAQKVGESEIQKLRGTEFRPVEDKEFAISSYDLSLILRFHSTYSCLPDYFGDLCEIFCAKNAVEYGCDQQGNMICKSGYIMDHKLDRCRIDQCKSNPPFCQNGGTCLNNLDATGRSSQPVCLCPANFTGNYCEQVIKTGVLKQAKLYENLVEIDFSKENNHSMIEYNVTGNNSNSRKGVTNGDWNKQITKYPLLEEQKHLFEVTDALISSTELTPSYVLEMMLNAKKSKYIEDQKWRRIIFLITIGIGSILTLLLIFIALIFCMWRRRFTVEKRPMTPNVIQSDVLIPSSSPHRRWASVRQSPMRIINHNNNNTSYTGLTTFGLNQRTSFQLDTDLNDGQSTAIYPYSLPTTNLINPTEDVEFVDDRREPQQIPIRENQYSGNVFATLPRHLCQTNRRLTWDVGCRAINYNSFINADQMDNYHQMTSTMMTNRCLMNSSINNHNNNNIDKVTGLHNSFQYIPYDTTMYDDEHNEPMSSNGALQMSCCDTNNAFYSNNITYSNDIGGDGNNDEGAYLTDNSKHQYHQQQQIQTSCAPPPIEFADARTTFC